MIYEKLLRPILFSTWADPEDAHAFAMKSLERMSRSRLLSGAAAALCTVKNPALERDLMGLHFRNPVGLAGGFDKNAHAIRGFEALGFGFIEIGTVTWHPQPGNPRPRVFRYPAEQAIINRFGFNNDGAEAIAARLAADTAPRKAVLGISLGKSKITPLDNAVDDYLKSLRVLYAHGDYFAINVSSPNTPGLRQLQDKSALDELLAALSDEAEVLQRKVAWALLPANSDSSTNVAKASPTKPGVANAALSATPTVSKPDDGGQKCPPHEPQTINNSTGHLTKLRKPLLVKIAPDLEPQALDELLEVCTRRGVDGLIATNTTLSRDGLNTTTEQTGGLSGKPLFPRSLAILRHIRQQLPGTPLIGVGGIMAPNDAQQMLEAGADLIQIYTGFIYKGPLFARKINRELIQVAKTSSR